MNTARIYKDFNGVDRTIHQMVKMEPEWAASRIQAGEDALATIARTKEVKLSFDDALKIARGCTDYGGGYRNSAEYEIYQHGIQTVINALEAASRLGLT